MTSKYLPTIGVHRRSFLGSSGRLVVRHRRGGGLCCHGPSAAPLVALGNTIIERSPFAFQDFVISMFGTSIRLVLFISMVVVGTLLAVALGMLAARRLRVACGVTVVVIGGPRHGGRHPANNAYIEVHPTLIGGPLGLATLVTLLKSVRPRAARQVTNPEPEADSLRRTFVPLAAAGTFVSAVSPTFGRSVRTFSCEVSQDVRAAIRRMVLPSPVVRAATISESATVGVDGVDPSSPVTQISSASTPRSLFRN